MMSSMDESSSRMTSFASVAGDTKSLVLALQGLQEKIRRLEEDRNFHRAQCEEAHRAHDIYKREVETQLEKERSDHRRRVEDLEALIRKASRERAEMEERGQNASKDIAEFQKQITETTNTERINSRNREESLRKELDSYRKEIVEMRHQHDKLRQSAAQLQTERELILSTNKRLESTVSELIAMNGKIIGGKAAQQIGGGGMGAARNGGRVPSRTASALAPRRTATAAATTPRYADPNMSTGSRGSRGGGSGGYAAPTATSIARNSPTAHRTRSNSRDGGYAAATASAPISGGARGAPLDKVYDDVEREYELLVQRYKTLMQGGASEAELQDVLSLIDHKSDQLRLLRIARVKKAPGGGGGAAGPQSGRSSNGRRTPTRRTSPRGSGKAVRKGTIVNHLRQMLYAPQD